MSNQDKLSKLNASFGSYKAEWLKGKVFDLFAEPYYFNALQDNRPCVVEGGRGTGKTTVLRGLSYQGQYALNGNDINLFDKKEFFGIYHRVNTNHVRSFINDGISTRVWIKIFSHYLNLIICREVLLFLKWHKQLKSDDQILDTETCILLSKYLHFKNSDCADHSTLLSNVDQELYSFQSKINNISDGNIPELSMIGDPIKILVEHVINLKQFKNKILFILIDEYENFEDYQQQVVNTLIKHNPESYTFKIGVRELGWRIKHTMNSSELLNDPADYVLINIEKKFASSDSIFSDFAKKVCQQRLNQIFFEDGNDKIIEIEKALNSLTVEEEAELLDVSNTDYVKMFEQLTEEEKGKTEGIPKLYKYFISYWAHWHQSTLSKSIDDFCTYRKKWNTRYENYKYDMLFKIRVGRGKRGIQKYYSGWKTYTKMANGNIRYLMELFYKAYEKHLSEKGSLSSAIPAETQTYAAQEVGLKNLMELEGIENGGQLTKFLLGFGRVFQVLAKSEGKLAPETNQFSIENSEIFTDETNRIITPAVMHLALVRSPGNKLNSEYHTKDYDYMIHPIFSAFFVFSYRKKRKILVRQSDITGIIDSPKKVITSLLKRSENNIEFDFSIPNQLSLFEDFYNYDQL